MGDIVYYLFYAMWAVSVQVYALCTILLEYQVRLPSGIKNLYVMTCKDALFLLWLQSLWQTGRLARYSSAST